jgi:hypothetical protein
VSDAAKRQVEPDAGLLEFLGDIDEVNDESQDEDFTDFLANNDIDKLKDATKSPEKPVKVQDERP